MVFSDSSGKAGLVEDIDFWVGSDSVSYVIAQKTRNINAWLDHVISLILQSDGKWEWDDLNQSDLPVKTANLVSGTQSYAIDITYLKLRGVSVADQSGVFHYLDRIDEKSPPAGSVDIFDTSITSGTPTAYSLQGKYIVLNRRPSYSSTGGIKYHMQRDGVYFTSADTTATPGFAKQFHRILSLGAALDYAIKHELPQGVIVNMQNRIKEFETGIMEFYSSRDQDNKVSLSLSKEDYGINDSNDTMSENSFNI